MRGKILIFCIIFSISLNANAFAQESARNSNEIILTDQELFVIFGSFIAAVIGIFLYLARNQILRKKTAYDKGEFESQKNKDYEKYHSDWTSDEYLGSEKISKDEAEFKKLKKNSELPDYYEVLGVPNTASDKEIKERFRVLAKEWHPDRNPDPETKEKMAELNKAYEVLSDKERKKNYDKYFN